MKSFFFRKVNNKVLVFGYLRVVSMEEKLEENNERRRRQKVSTLDRYCACAIKCRNLAHHVRFDAAARAIGRTTPRKRASLSRTSKFGTEPSTKLGVVGMK